MLICYIEVNVSDVHVQWRQTGTWPPRNPLMPESVLLHSLPSPRIETHSKLHKYLEYQIF